MSDELPADDRAIPPVTKPVPVDEKLTNPHPLIAVAQEQLRVAIPAEDLLLHTDASSAADIRIGRDLCDRALRIFDAFAKGWEQAGGELSFGHIGEMPCTAAAMGPDCVAIHVSQTSDLPTRGRRPADSALRNQPRLCIVVGEGRIQGIKGTWADTKSIPLEKAAPRSTSLCRSGEAEPGGAIRHWSICKYCPADYASCAMRSGSSGAVWTYHARVRHDGAPGQDAHHPLRGRSQSRHWRRCLMRAHDAYLFSPAEADRDGHRKLS